MQTIYGKPVYDKLAEMVDPGHTALLVIDLQNDFCSPEGHFAKSGLDVSNQERMIPSAIDFIRKARQAGVMVAFLQNTTLRDARSESLAWLRFKSRVTGIAPEYTLEGSWGHKLCDGIEPLKGEPVIMKHRPSAFVNTSLDLILRSSGIKTIVLIGVVTNGCVMGTAMQGVYLDYYVVVARDLVRSNSQELHEAALKIMESRLEVVGSKEICQAWGV